MRFTFAHNNLNVYDLEKSLDFYEKALGLTVTRTKEAEDGSLKHKEMGCICFENPGMGIYFISDPDGYWLEIIPAK